jgi:Lrp/AsnC family transcriptional regulator, leucine-responsive regulatory protein
MSIELDDIDMKLLALLEEDGRMSHVALGKEVNLTGPSVYARIQRLEREGVIRRYTALLDPQAIGQGLLALVRVSTGLERDLSLRDEFENFVLNEPQILEAHDVDGEDSYLLKVRTASPQTLRELLARIRSYPFVTRTITSIALVTIKERGMTGPLCTNSPISH